MMIITLYLVQNNSEDVVHFLNERQAPEVKGRRYLSNKRNMLLDTAVFIVQEFSGWTCLDGVSRTVCTGVICDKWLPLTEEITQWVCETQLADLQIRSWLFSLPEIETSWTY